MRVINNLFFTTVSIHSNETLFFTYYKIPYIISSCKIIYNTQDNYNWDN